MSDADFMLRVLSDGQPHSTMDLIQRSVAERGCGLTPHSRAAELRKRGLIVACHRLPGPRWHDRPTYQYVLLAPSEASDLPGGDPAASPSGAEAASEASLGARTTCDGLSVESGGALDVSPVSPSPLPSQTTPAASSDVQETRALPLFDVPNQPLWA